MKFKHILEDIAMAILRFFVYSLIALLAAFAVCLIASMPEIIGTLLFG